jgi:ribulose-bisphosphate carboxylase large chain
MKPIAAVARIIGVDQLHVGTVVGKMSETRKEVLENIDACKSEMGNLRPVLPVASGGLHPRLVPALLETFGNDVVIQAGGGIHGNPLGTVSGAKAMRQAVDATLEGKTLEEYAKTHKELQAALDTWKV